MELEEELALWISLIEQKQKICSSVCFGWISWFKIPWFIPLYTDGKNWGQDQWNDLTQGSQIINSHARLKQSTFLWACSCIFPVTLHGLLLGGKERLQNPWTQIFKFPIMFVFWSSFEGSKWEGVGVSKVREALEVGQRVNFGEDLPKKCP